MHWHTGYVDSETKGFRRRRLEFKQIPLTSLIIPVDLVHRRLGILERPAMAHRDNCSGGGIPRGDTEYRGGEGDGGPFLVLGRL